MPMTMTNEQALAVLDAEIESCGRIYPDECENCARLRTVRAHFAAVLEREARLVEAARYFARNFSGKNSDKLKKALSHYPEPTP